MNHFFKLLDQSPRERCLSTTSNEIESPRLDTLGAKARKFFSKMNMFTKVREFRDNVSDVSAASCSKTKESPSRKFRNEIKISKNSNSDVFQDNFIGCTSYHSAICKSYDSNAKLWQMDTENSPKSADMYQPDINLCWSNCEKKVNSTSSFLSLEEFYPTEDENSREMSTGTKQPRVEKHSLKTREQESESDVSFKSLKTNFITEFKNADKQFKEQSRISYEDVNVSFPSLENVIQNGIDNTKEKMKEGNEHSLGKDNLEVLDMDLTCNIPKSLCIKNDVESFENVMQANDNDNANNTELSLLSSKSSSGDNMSENLAILTSMDELDSLNVGILMNDLSEGVEDPDANIAENCITDKNMHEISEQNPGTPLLDNEDYPHAIESSSQKLDYDNMENVHELEISLKEPTTIENTSENASSFFEYLNVSNIESLGDKHLLETDEMIPMEKSNRTPNCKKFQKTSSPNSMSNDSGYQNHLSALSAERSSPSVSACYSRDVSYEPKTVKDLANTSGLYLTAMEDAAKIDNDSNDCLAMKTSDLLIQ